MKLLVGDVGGTNTRLALANGSVVDPSTVSKFKNDTFSSLSDVIRAYCESHRIANLDSSCVALAGPVRNGSGELTNLNWSMSAAELRQVTNCKHPFVINDLSAQGYAIDTVDVKHIRGASKTLNPRETRLVVGIGTGFNAAPVFQTPTGLLVPPGEAGHVSLPQWNASVGRVAKSVEKTHGTATIEDVLSGRGVATVYEGLTGTALEVPASVIFDRVQSDPTQLDIEIFETIIGTMARVLADLALVYLPFGGIVLIGGMARRLATLMDQFNFEEGFVDKGRFSDFVKDFSIFTLEDDFAALAGCASYASGQLETKS